MMMVQMQHRRCGQGLLRVIANNNTNVGVVVANVPGMCEVDLPFSWVDADMQALVLSLKVAGQCLPGVWFVFWQSD